MTMTRILVLIALLFPVVSVAETPQRVLTVETADASYAFNDPVVYGRPILLARFDAATTGKPILLAQADTGSARPTLPDVGSGSALADPAPVVTIQPADIGVATKLYKNGSFFALGIMVVFVGLSIWSKLDKKHAFYAATALGGLALLVESIRRGDTPNATSVMTMLMTTAGIMIAGPGHTKA